MRNYAYFTSEKGNWNQHKILNNQDIINVINTKNIKLEHKTGTRFSYCNTNYALLALIIEKVTKKSYAEAMKTMLFQPLGMKNTFVYNYKTDQDTVVPSYRFTNRKVAFDYLDGIYGDKNIYSTPQDLLKFDLARNSPYFLTPELRGKIYEGYSNEHKGEKNYGLGIRMIEWKTGQKFYFHNGWWHGNMSSYITLKKENAVIIALTNNYSKQVYRVRNLAPIFGDYPFKVTEDYE
jgi:CubicO group peptidase (beta-lactamase class C family)